MRKTVLGAVAAALIASGAMAQATPLPRTAAPVEDSEGLFGGSALLTVLGIVAVGLVIWQITEDDEDEPASP